MVETIYNLNKIDNVDWATRSDLEEIGSYNTGDFLMNFNRLIQYADEAFTLQDHTRGESKQILPSNVIVFNPYIFNMFSFENIFVHFDLLDDGRMVVAYDRFPILSSFADMTWTEDLGNKAQSGNYATFSVGATITARLYRDWTSTADRQARHHTRGLASHYLTKYIWESNEYSIRFRGRQGTLYDSSPVVTFQIRTKFGFNCNVGTIQSTSFQVATGTCSNGCSNFLQYTSGPQRSMSTSAGYSERIAQLDWMAFMRKGTTEFTTYPSTPVRTLEEGWVKYRIQKAGMKKVIIYGLFDLTGGEVEVKISTDNVTYTSITEVKEDTTINTRGTARFFVEDIDSSDVYIKLKITGTGGTSAEILRFGAMGF